MKGAIKTETIDGKSFDIRKEGSTIALECESIFFELIYGGGTPLDDNLSFSEIESFMMRGMNKRNTIRIKELFFDCVVSPKLDDDAFEDLPYEVIPSLFFRIYLYQTGRASKKKESSPKSQESQTSSEAKK